MIECQGQLTTEKDNKDPLRKKQPIAKTGTTSGSLRATVPEGIVAFLNLKSGDTLEWAKETRDNKRVAIVKKLG